MSLLLQLRQTAPRPRPAKPPAKWDGVLHLRGLVQATRDQAFRAVALGDVAGAKAAAQQCATWAQDMLHELDRVWVEAEPRSKFLAPSQEDLDEAARLGC